MIHGNWVAVHKGLIKFLPDDRPFTPLEAMFSLSVDVSNQKHVSVSGYATLWKWSRTKVRSFFKEIGVEIIRDRPLSEVQNQKGQIRGQIEDRSRTDKRQIRFIIDRGLYEIEDRSRTDRGQIEDRSEDTTIYPLNPNPNPKEEIHIQPSDPVKENYKNRAKNKKTIQKPDSVTDQTWEDFQIHRKNLKAPITQTVINSFLKQAELAEMTLEDALIESITRGWRGFKAEWTRNKQPKGTVNTNGFIDNTPDFMKDDKFFKMMEKS